MIRVISSFLKTFYMLIVKPHKFYARLAISSRLDFIIYERPGAWATEEELNELTSTLKSIAKSAQHKDELPEYGCLLGGRQDLAQRVISIAYDNKLKRAVGFSAQSYLDIEQGNFKEQVLHLGLIYIDPTYQGKSVSYLLAMLPNILIMIKNGFRDLWVSNVTQVPVIYGLVAANYYYVHPTNGKDSEQGFYHRYLAHQIFQNHKPVFGVGEDAFYDADLQIIKNSYTGGSDHLKKTFEITAKHRKQSYNDYCEKHLDYSRGDDFVQVGKLSANSFIQLFKNKKDSQSRIQLFINLLLFSVAALLLPILRWFIPSCSQNLKQEQHLPIVI